MAGQSPRLRTNSSRSSAGRSADERRMAIVRRLTARDRAIVRAVERHRVLTTEQLAEAFFPTRKRAWKRLGELYRLEVLARFQPFREGWGAYPLHFVVGRTGCALLAAERGEDPARAARAWRLDRAVAIAHQSHLAHLVGLNSIWAALVAEARRDPRHVRLKWMTEREAAKWTTEIVRPDAVIEWLEDDRFVDAMLEYDRGTEKLRVLVDKLPNYAQFEAERGRSVWVLFAFVSPGRETSARGALTGTDVPVATATLTTPPRPQDAIWLPLGAAVERVRLSHLADVPKPAAALRRAALGGHRAWRFDRPESGEEAPLDP